jgi:hypothetical protein
MIYKTELNRIFIQHHGIRWIILFLILYLSALQYFGFPTSRVQSENPKSYDYYLAKYQGPLSNEKKLEIEGDYQEAIRSRSELTAYYREHSDENDSYDSEQMIQHFLKLIRDETIITYFHKQLPYLGENIDERYIIDKSSWMVLLTESAAEWLWAVLLVVLLTPIFIYDHETGMSDIIVTTPIGSGELFRKRLLAGLSVTVIVTLIFWLSKWLFVEINSGLFGYSYPLQSLDVFHNSTYDLSLFKAYMLQGAFKMLGALLLFSWIVFVSTTSKKSATTLVFGLMYCVLPALVLNGTNLLYHLPTPTSWMLNSGFLYGDQYPFSSLNMDQTPYFTHILPVDMLFSAGVTLVVSIGLNCFSYWITFRKVHTIHFRRMLLQCVSIGWMMLLFIFTLNFETLSGFEPEDRTVHAYPIIVRSDTSFYQGASEKYDLAYDPESKNISCSEKTTGKTFSLVRSPLPENLWVSGIFVYDNQCYYIAKLFNKAGMQVFVIDLETFDQELVYSSLSQEDAFIYGKEEENILSMMTDYKALFVDGDYLYYADSFDRLVQIELKSGHPKTLTYDLSPLGSLYYSSGDIYYLDKSNHIVKYDVVKDQTLTIDNIKTERFYMDAISLNYEDLLDSKKTKIIHLDDLVFR